MSNADRAAMVQQRLAQARQGVLDVAGKGAEAAAAQYLDPSKEAWRQALRQRLAAARGSTYTYKDPNKIAGNPNDPRSININMGGGAGGYIGRPPGWGDTKKGKKEKRAATGAATSAATVAQRRATQGRAGGAGSGAGAGGAGVGGGGMGGMGGMTASSGNASRIVPSGTRGMRYATSGSRFTNFFSNLLSRE